MVTNWFLRSMQVVLLFTAQCQPWEVRNVTVTPADLEAVVGHWNTNFTCVLNRNMQGHYNASDLYFTYQIGSSDTKDVPLVYVKTVNDSAIELRHFPEIDEDINASQKYITCRIKGQTCGRNVIVNIRKPHENPQVKDIDVENWETLSFAWETKEDLLVMHSMGYKAWYWNDSNDEHPLQCEHYEGSVCKIPNPFEVASPGDMLIIKVNGSVETSKSCGILETVTSEEVRVNLINYLRPRKINQINVSQNQSIKTLVFKPPKTSQRILYDIHVNCTKPSFFQSKNITRLIRDFKEATHSDRNSEKISVREPLVGLPPDSNCTVSVRAISVNGGKWSQWTYHEFQTLQDVPLAAPGSCKGCFQVKEAGIDSLFDVIVYFTPLSEEEARGRVELYRIKMIENADRDNVTKELSPDPLPSFLLSNLSNESDYKISIEAKTKSGYNETLDLSSSTILVPQSKHRPKSLPHKFIVVVLNKTAVRTTWKMEERNDTHKVFLFWCKGRVESNTPCQDVLKWKEFPIASTGNAINITDVIILDKEESYNNFIFGTGIERNGKSSGITWNSCTYDIRSRPPKPSIETYHSTSSGISISLLEPSCQNIGEARGFVIGYRLFLCPIESSDSTDDRRCLKEMPILEFHGQHKVLTLKELNPSQTYLIMISSLSETKTSENVTMTATTLAAEISFVWVVWVVIASVVVFAVVFVVVVIYFVPLKEKTIWQYFKDIRTVGPIVIPPAVKFANFDSGQRLAEDEGYKSNGSGGTENDAMNVADPLFCLDSSGSQYYSDESHADNNCSTRISVPIDDDVPDTCIHSRIVDVPVAFNGSDNVDAPVDNETAIDISVASDVPIAIDVPFAVNANAAVLLIPSVCAEMSSLGPIISYTSVDDCSDRILPSLFTCSTNASRDDHSISEISRGKAEDETSQHRLQLPHEPASKALLHTSSSGSESFDPDQCYTGKATGQPTYDDMLFKKPSSNLDEDYVGGSQRVCDVFLPVPSEPAKPVMFDSGSEFNIDGSEDGLSSLQTEIYDSSAARNEDVSSETGYHHASKLSPSRSADSVCDETQNDSDYPPMRIIEVDFYDDNGKLEKDPVTDDVTISTDGIMISDDVTFSTDFKSTGDIAVSTGDIISADVIALPDVMTISDDLVSKRPVDCSPKGVLSVCGNYDRDESVDEDCIYSTVVDVNVSCREVGLVDQIPPVSGEVDDGYYSGCQVLGSLSSSPKTASDGSEGGYWSLRDDVQDQRHTDWSVNPVSLNQSSSTIPRPLNLEPTDSEPFLERVLPSILPPCV